MPEGKNSDSKPTRNGARGRRPSRHDAVLRRLDELAARVDEIAARLESRPAATSTPPETAPPSRESERIGTIIATAAEGGARANLNALRETLAATRTAEDGRGFLAIANKVSALSSTAGKMRERIDHQVSGVRNAARDATPAKPRRASVSAVAAPVRPRTDIGRADAATRSLSEIAAAIDAKIVALLSKLRGNERS